MSLTLASLELQEPLQELTLPESWLWKAVLASKHQLGLLLDGKKRRDALQPWTVPDCNLFHPFCFYKIHLPAIRTQATSSLAFLLQVLKMVLIGGLTEL